MNEKNERNLLPLVARLKACPAHDTGISRQLFLECWDDLRREDVTPLLTPAVPVMAALVLHNDRFAPLLTEAEQTQLLALVKLAVDRYNQKAHPTNKLGRLLAGIIKK
jgi:hypothetical protein